MWFRSKHNKLQIHKKTMWLGNTNCQKKGKQYEWVWLITANYKLTKKERKPIRLGASCIFTFLRRNPRRGTKGLDKLWQWQSVNNWPSAVAMAKAIVLASWSLNVAIVMVIAIVLAIATLKFWGNYSQLKIENLQ